MPSEDHILDVRGLRVGFGATDVVRDASFSIERGQTLALVGRSGAGKTALAQCILRLLEPSGRILGGQIVFRADREEPLDIAALPLHSRRLRQLRGGKIAMVFQEPAAALSSVHTIGDAVMEAARLHGAPNRRQAHARAAAMLGKVGFSDPEKRMRQYPFEFSGGMRQRAMIAAALVSRPELLIADEPTTALDVTVQAQILDLLAQLKREMGLSMLFITHDLGIVSKIADRIVVIEYGRIVETGPVTQVMHSPREAITQELVAAAEKRQIEARYPTAARPPAEVLLKVTDLRKTFQLRRTRLFGSVQEDVHAVDGISFELRRGETLGIVGESGSGKTTAVRCILRAIAPTSGTVLFTSDGQTVDVTRARPKQLKALRRRMQMVFQDPYSSLNPRMRVEELVGEPLLIHNLGHKTERRERVAAMLGQVGLDPHCAIRFPNEFSAGQRQRIAIARALILHPALVVADEAVSSLDALMQNQILRLLKDLQASLGATYILVAHDLGVVRAFCDQVLVMRSGKMVEIGTVDDVMRHPKDPYTRSLIEAAGIARPADQPRLNALASS